jgi:hypothetical protein
MNDPVPFSESVPVPAKEQRRRNRAVLILAGSLLAAAGVFYGVYEYRGHLAAKQKLAEQEAWMKKQKGLSPSGGKFFTDRVVIPVPVFAQSDPRWGEDALGPSTTDTLSSAGCAVSSCAMILASYGVDTDPQRLNDFLKQNNGFTADAWLEWSVAAQLNPEKVKFIYEDDPSFQLIDDNLAAGNPVIVRLRYPSGITHFVVVCGKDGHDYLIADPGRRASDGVYPLKEFGSNIEALRFYEPVAQ